MNVGNVLSKFITGLQPEPHNFELRARDGAGNASTVAGPIVGTPTGSGGGSFTPIRVNCGGLAYGSFEADATNAYHGGTGVASGVSFSEPDLTGVTDPAPPEVYTKCRANDPGLDFTYTFPVLASRNYKVRLHWTVGGSFPWGGSFPMIITLNGVAQPEIDPFIDAGSPSPSEGYVQEYTVSQGVGTSLTVKFEGDGVSYPMINAIEVLEVGSMSIPTLYLPEASVGEAYSATVETDDESGAVTWAVHLGTLPAGLTLNASTGEISGTASVVGVYSFIVRATDGSMATADRYFNLVVAEPIEEFYLDEISADVKICAGPIKRRAAYSGPCLRVERASDSSEQDIDFNSNNVLDMAALFTFVGSSAYRVIGYYDQSTEGNDLLTSYTEGQDLIPGYFRGRFPGLKWVRDGAYITGSIDWTQPKVFMAAHFKQTSKPASFLFAAWQFRGAVIHGGLTMYNGSYTTNGRFDGGYKQLTFNFVPGDDKIRIDGTDYPSISTSVNPTDAGDSGASGAFYLGSYHAVDANEYMSGAVGEILVIDGAISDADRNLIESSQSSLFIGDDAPAEPIGFANNVILEGDSRSAGYLATTNPTIELYKLKPTNWRFRNVSNSGQNLLGEMTTDAAVQIDPYFDEIYDENILILWGFINDLHDNPALGSAEIIAGYEAYIAARLAANPTLKIILCTDTGADPAISYITAGQQDDVDDVNTWIRTVPTGVAAVCDLAARTNLSDITDTDYFPDGLHISDLGYEDEVGVGMNETIDSIL